MGSALIFLLTTLGAEVAIAQGQPGGGGAPATSNTAQGQAQPPSQRSGGGGFSGGASASVSSGGGSPDALFGLKPAAHPRVVPLPEAIALSVTNNFDLRIAKERIVQSEANVRRAWAALLPQVNLGGTYQFNYPEQSVRLGSDEQLRQQALLYRSLANITDSTAILQSDPRQRAAAAEQSEQLRGVASQFENTKVEDIVVAPAHQLGANLNITIPIFNGRAIPLLQNAYEAVDLVKMSNDQVRVALVHAVARAYYGAVTTEKFVIIAEQQLANSKRHRDATRDRVELGITTPLSLQRAELDVLRAEQNVLASRNGLAVTIAALGNLMDVDESFLIAAPQALPAVELQGDLDALIARALAARPDLRVQKAALSIADRGRTDAWMQFLPSLGLTMQGRWTSNTGGFTNQPFTGAVLLNASIPLYDGGARYAALQESGSKIREELLRVRQMERRIAGQVRGNVADVAIKRQALVTTRKSVELSQKTSQNAQNLYELGMATSLDVIDANLAVFISEIELARAELALEQARLSLTYILGEMPAAPELTPLELSDEEDKKARARMDGLAD